MRRYIATIVYKNGLSRGAAVTKHNKAEAIEYFLETDPHTEDIVSITVLEYIREEI